MTLTFGHCPHPPFEDRLIKDYENMAWDGLGPRKILGVVQHTMVGTLQGTDAYFRRGTASTGLTDYGIGGASDGNLDGVIYRWNDPFGAPHPGVSPHRWPWASGPINAPNGDGPAFVNKYGSNAVNGYLVSVERSDGGNPDVPPSDKYSESFAQLMAYFADVAQCPWDEFAILPSNGLSFHYFHSEFNSGKSCPAGCRPYVDDLQARVREILKSYQTADAEEDDALADLPKSDHVLDPNLIWEDASTGAVGKLWRSYGEATGSFGEPSQPWNDVMEDGSKLYVFTNGLTIAVKDGQAGIVVKVK